MPSRVSETSHQRGCNGTMNGTLQNFEKDEIVISGISGRLPESNSIAEFRENLFNGVDMVTDDDRRWPAGEYITKNIFFNYYHP